jgi:hypothetical protein
VLHNFYAAPAPGKNLMRLQFRLLHYYLASQLFFPNKSTKDLDYFFLSIFNYWNCCKNVTGKSKKLFQCNFRAVYAGAGNRAASSYGYDFIKFMRLWLRNTVCRLVLSHTAVIPQTRILRIECQRVRCHIQKNRSCLGWFFVWKILSFCTSYYKSLKGRVRRVCSTFQRNIL